MQERTAGSGSSSPPQEDRRPAGCLLLGSREHPLRAPGHLPTHLGCHPGPRRRTREMCFHLSHAPLPSALPVSSEPACVLSAPQARQAPAPCAPHRFLSQRTHGKSGARGRWSGRGLRPPREPPISGGHSTPVKPPKPTAEEHIWPLVWLTSPGTGHTFIFKEAPGPPRGARVEQVCRA